MHSSPVVCNFALDFIQPLDLLNNDTCLQFINIFFSHDESQNEAPHPSKVLRSKKSFMYNKYGYIKVYVDGACSSNGRIGAGAGIGVWFGHGHHL